MINSIEPTNGDDSSPGQQPPVDSASAARGPLVLTSRADPGKGCAGCWKRSASVERGNGGLFRAGGWLFQGNDCLFRWNDWLVRGNGGFFRGSGWLVRGNGRLLR